MTKTNIQTLDLFAAKVEVNVEMTWPEFNEEQVLSILQGMMKAQDLTVKDIEERTGLHYNTLNKLLKKGEMGADSRVKLLNGLGLSVRICV